MNFHIRRARERKKEEKVPLKNLFFLDFVQVVQKQFHVRFFSSSPNGFEREETPMEQKAVYGHRSRRIRFFNHDDDDDDDDDIRNGDRNK